MIIRNFFFSAVIALCAVGFAQDETVDGNLEVVGSISTNKNYRPIYLRHNGGNGVYGSEIGFNAILDTQASPNEFIKLGGTSQVGGANIAVNQWGAMQFQMFDSNTTDETRVIYRPQIVFSPKGYVGIGTTDPKQVLDFDGRMKNVRFHYTHLGETGSSAGTLLGNNLRASTTTYSQIEVGASAIDAAHGIYMRYNSGWHFLSLPQNHGNGVGTPVDLSSNTKMIITNAGNVGIGTTAPANALDVNGTIRAKEIIVATNWPDYVFEKGYRLRNLAEVEAHIADHGHLPGIPSAAQIAETGVSVGDAQRLLLEKIEELTLYAIEKNRRIEALESRLSRRDARIEELLVRLDSIEKELSK